MPQMPRRFVSADELAYYRAHFREALREDAVVCLECGAVLRSLPQHVWRHGLPAEDYKAKWGYNRRTALIIPALHEVLRQHALARNLSMLTPSWAWPMAQEARRRGAPPDRLESRLAKGAATRARRAAGWQPRRPKVDDATLLALAGAGLTRSQIAIQTGIAYNTVCHRLNALRPTGVKRRKVDDATLRAAAEGGTAREVAARVGLHCSTVWRRLRKLGVPRSDRNADKPKVTDAEVLALRAAGLWYREIAAQTGLTLQIVRRRLHKLRQQGLLPPDREPRFRKVDNSTLLGVAAAGGTIREIAARVGLHPVYVGDRLRKLGIYRQGPRRHKVPNADLLALAAAGLTNREIGARTGMSRNAVWKRLHSLHPARTLQRPRGGGPGPKKKVDDATLRAVAAEGGTAREIAARVGLHPNRVGIRLRKLGIYRQASRQLKVTTADLLALRQAGLLYREIAERTGLTVRAVTHRFSRLRQSGIDVPRPARPQANPRRKVSDEDLLALLQTGLSRDDIADRVGMHVNAVQKRIRWLRLRGLLPPRQKVDDATVLALRQAGLRYREIAERTGLTVRAVEDRLSRLRQRAADVPHPSRRPPVRTFAPRRRGRRIARD